jgi:predicted patatin/cPLA2 family phospholipase
VHPVLEVLLARRDRADRPGDRGDDHTVVLAVEGGGSRATLSAGMVAALAELGLGQAFDAVYGASAGSINGAWFVAGAADEGAAAWSRPGVMRRVTGVARLLLGRPVVDMVWVVDELYEHIVPLDWHAVRTASTELHPMATDADTGASVDLRPLMNDTASLKTALRASTHLPILGGPPVVLDGRRFLDAALAETLPFRTPLDAGATHVLLLRTRREDDPARPPWRSGDLLARAVLARATPGAAALWRTRHERLLADDAWLTGPGAARVLAVRPLPGSPDVGQLETDPATLRAAVATGREAVRALVAVGR